MIEEFVTGTRPVREPDRVLATVLFTDIVDSTRRAADLGDRRWRDVLERHNRVVRADLGFGPVRDPRLWYHRGTTGRVLSDEPNAKPPR